MTLKCLDNGKKYLVAIDFFTPNNQLVCYRKACNGKNVSQVSYKSIKINNFLRYRKKLYSARDAKNTFWVS